MRGKGQMGPHCDLELLDGLLLIRFEGWVRHFERIEGRGRTQATRLVTLSRSRRVDSASTNIGHAASTRQTTTQGH